MPRAFLQPVTLLFTYTLPCWVAYRLSVRYRRHTTPDRNREWGYFILYAYFVVLVAVTLLPVSFSRFNNLHTRGINLWPVKHTWQDISAMFSVNDGMATIYALENIIGNILLFIPLGFLLPVIFHRMRSFQKVLLSGVTLSVLIEASQWLSRICGIYRFVDIDDVLLNTTGTAIGYWIAYAGLSRTGRLHNAE